jgi:hypothetical protein
MIPDRGRKRSIDKVCKWEEEGEEEGSSLID